MSCGAKIAAWVIALALPVAGQSVPAKSSPGSSRSAPSPDDALLCPVGGGTAAPKAISAPDPQLTKAEWEKVKRAPEPTTVVVVAVISEDGKVLEARVKHSADRRLDKAAVEAVKKWKFEPARKDGKPVKVMVNIEINFHLDPPSSPPASTNH